MSATTGGPYNGYLIERQSSRYENVHDPRVAVLTRARKRARFQYFEPSRLPPVRQRDFVRGEAYRL